jgi:hypothetical protein
MLSAAATAARASATIAATDSSLSEATCFGSWFVFGPDMGLPPSSWEWIAPDAAPRGPGEVY